MEKTWKPTVTGILDIIAGILSLLAFVLLAVGLLVFMPIGGAALPVQIPAHLLPMIIIALSIPVLILVVLSIVGGAYALRRKIWGLALAGSIAAFFCSWPLGIAAIVLIVISRKEFD